MRAYAGDRIDGDTTSHTALVTQWTNVLLDHRGAMAVFIEHKYAAIDHLARTLFQLFSRIVEGVDDTHEHEGKKPHEQ